MSGKDQVLGPPPAASRGDEDTHGHSATGCGSPQRQLHHQAYHLFQMVHLGLGDA